MTIVLLTRKEMLSLVPFTYKTVWKKMQAGTFPRARDTGHGSVWLESEIEEWKLSLPYRPMKGDPGHVAPAFSQAPNNPRNGTLGPVKKAKANGGTNG